MGKGSGDHCASAARALRASGACREPRIPEWRNRLMHRAVPFLVAMGLLVAVGHLARGADDPAVPGCADRCAAMGAEMEQRCHGSDGTVDAACLAAVQAHVAACVEACENPPPPPDPTCPELCKRRVVEDAEACVAAGGNRDECWRNAEALLRGCLQTECGIQPPPPPLPCADRCENLRADLLQKCVGENGQVVDEACLAEVEATVERCRANCVDPQPPPGSDCKDECVAAAEKATAECLASNLPAEECAARKRRVLEECLQLCAAPPPEQPPTCEERCRERVAKIKESCADPTSPVLPEECARQIEEALRACLAEDCSTDPPPAATCEDRCKLHARHVYEACAQNGLVDAECENRAAEAFRQCAVGCSQTPPPAEPPGCDSLCLSQAKAKFRTCVAAGGSEETCRAEADTLLGLCLQRCAAGAPCENRCAVAAEVVADGCALGGLSPEECLRLANVVLAGCVTGCRPEVSCAERCDQLATSAARECLARGGTEAECAAKADEVRTGCLPNCESGEAPPCDAQCEEKADALVAEWLAAGKTEEECVALRERFVNQCAAEHGSNCAEELKADSTQFRPFLRGDSNRDGRRNISDPISLLGWLFLGDGEPTCKDAADANDDGQLNVSDSITMLGYLFLGAGPLPEPIEREGQDATDDALACAE